MCIADPRRAEPGACLLLPCGPASSQRKLCFSTRSWQGEGNHPQRSVLSDAPPPPLLPIYEPGRAAMWSPAGCASFVAACPSRLRALQVRAQPFAILLACPAPALLAVCPQPLHLQHHVVGPRDLRPTSPPPTVPAPSRTSEQRELPSARSSVPDCSALRVMEREGHLPLSCSGSAALLCLCRPNIPKPQCAKGGPQVHDPRLVTGRRTHIELLYAVRLLETSRGSQGSIPFQKLHCAKYMKENVRTMCRLRAVGTAAIRWCGSIIYDDGVRKLWKGKGH